MAHSTDTVTYKLHFRSSPRPASETITSYALALLSPLHRPWLWNSEPFTVDSSYQGSVHFGNNIEDEWVVVWMLFEITRKWDAAVEVRDEDGEFLLIEAAQGLEEWCEPGNTENRVFIYSGKLHIVPPTIHPLDTPLNVEHAVSLLGSSTLAPPAVQEILSDRLSNYPSSLPTAHQHRTLAYLPPTISHLLALDPQLISHAVQAFADRSMGTKRNLNPRFRPIQFGEELLTKVDLTRVMFAELVGGGDCYPDRRWRELGWSSEREEADKKRWMEIGVRIIRGFEEAYERSRKGQSHETNDDEFKRTVRRLEKEGYFEGELEGSKRWKELEERVRVGYNRRRESRKDSEDQDSFASKVDRLLSTSDMPSSSIKQIPTKDDEDSFDWMEMSPEHLDQLLSRYQSSTRKDDGMDVDGNMQQGEDEKLLQQEAEKLERFAKEVGGFVEEGKGDWEGARFKEEEESDEEDEDEEEVKGPTAEEFRAAQDKLIEPLPSSEWGRKPTLPNKSSPSPQTSRSVTEPSQPPVLTKESYDGVVSDDSDSDDEDNMFAADGDEMEEFLSFAKEALGIGEAQWEGILSERRGRGAFVPPDPKSRAKGKDKDKEKVRVKKSELPTDEEMIAHVERTRTEPPPIDLLPNLPNASTSNKPSESSAFPDILPKDHPLLNEQSMKVLDALLKNIEKEEGKEMPYHPSKTKAKDVKDKFPPMEQRNQELDNFEKLMDAMDAELAKQRKAFESRPSNAVKSSKHKSSQAPIAKGKQRAVADEDSDDEEAMEAEFANLVKGEGEELDVDVGMLKNLLESLKSQAGAAGPVGNLAGRLGVDDLAMDLD
ncbi:SGT1-domain-containing protein [Atractiella rhizophila]|nr:SGT1-domain-containing protein [Atractiella rhizophila]